MPPIEKINGIFLKTALFLFLFFSGMKINAQYLITGSVYDEDSIGVEFVNIYAIKNDSIYYSSTMTDSLGFFELSVEKGNYQILFRFIGLEADSLSLEVMSNMVCRPILLKKVVNNLDDIIVVAKKPNITRKVDRLVFNFENSISVQGGNALDALKLTPGVNLRNNTLSMIGKNEVQLMINGEIQNLSGQQITDYLATISASDIKNIEVITTPPANFNSEGNIGIININMKSNLKDYWKSRLTFLQDQATYSQRSHLGNLAVQRGKFDMVCNWTLSRGKWLSITRQIIDYSNQKVVMFDRANDYSNRNNLTLNTSYRFNKFNKIGGRYLGSIDNPNNRNVISTVITPENLQYNSSKIETNYNKDNTNTFNAATLSLDHLFDTLGLKGVLTLDYFDVHKNTDQIIDSKTSTLDVINSTFYGLNSGRYTIQNFAVNSDFNNTKHKIKLDFGAKYSYTKSQSDLVYANTDLLVESYHDIFVYFEDNIAGYLSAQTDIGSKVSVKAGLRSEFTKTEGLLTLANELYINNYLKFFPTLYITYDKSNLSSFSFEYSKRINRPKFTMLNPFKIYNNPYYYISGNPFLTPSYVHNIRLTNVYRDHLISALFFKHSDNEFSLLPNIENGTIEQNAVMQNFISSNQIGISESFDYDYKDYFSIYMSFDFTYVKNYSTSSLTRKINEGINSAISSNLSVNINRAKSLKCFVDIMYNLPSVYSMSKYHGIFNTDLTLRGMICKNKLVIDITIHDVFQTNTIQWIDLINGINMYNSYRADNTYLTLELSYSFGNSKVRPQNTKIGNNDEIMRSR